MDERDQYLWQLAKKRAGFKKHLASYIIINGFLWALWFFTSRGNPEDDFNGVPWPIWSTLGWGVGLAFSYYNAYMSNHERDTINEYQKLKDKEQEK